MSKKGGPVTARGKRIASRNSAKHLWRLQGIRPCTRSCPIYEECEERVEIGEPCPVEQAEFAAFVSRLAETFDLLAGDTAGEAACEVLGVQWLRIKRANAYLATLDHGGWSAKDKAYVLDEVRKLENNFLQGLGMLKNQHRTRRRVDLELRVLDPPIGESDDNPGSA